MNNKLAFFLQFPKAKIYILNILINLKLSFAIYNYKISKLKIYSSSKNLMRFKGIRQKKFHFILSNLQ